MRIASPICARAKPMNLKIWPFLFTRNQWLDYRGVLCPDFILDANRSGIFREVLPQDLGDTELEELTRVAHKTDRTLGELTFVYRTDVARIDGHAETDPQGRPIRRYFGAVVKGSVSERGVDPDRVMRSVVREAEETFARFWREKAFKPEPSMPRTFPEGHKLPGLDEAAWPAVRGAAKSGWTFHPAIPLMGSAIAIGFAIILTVWNTKLHEDIAGVVHQFAQEQNERGDQIREIQGKISILESELSRLRNASQSGSK